MIRRPAPLIVFAVLVCVLLWPVLAGGRVLLPGAMLHRMSPWNASASDAGDAHWNALAWDGIAYFYPARALLARAIKSGELPLWNPYQMCGTPFLADAQSAVLYPPNLLFAILPPDRALGLLAALHLFAAGAFTYLFLKGLGLGRIAATFGGITFMLGGFAVVWLELPVFLSTGVWLPLALYLIHLAHERRSAPYAAGAGIAIGLSLVGGHPQIAFYCLLTTALYWVYLAVSGRRRTAVWWSFALAGLTFGIGFALAAPQLLASAELAALSHRGGSSATAEGYAAYSALAVPVRTLITLLVPDFFGNPSKGTFWGAGEYAEYCSYVGVLPLLLVPLAFGGKGNPRKHAWFFSMLAALALLMALGTGVNRLFYFGVPGFARSGSPARVLVLFMFSVAALGALGLDRILNDDGKTRRHTVFRVLLSGLGVLVLVSLLLQSNLRLLQTELSTVEALRSLLPAVRMFPALLVVGIGLILLTVTGPLGRQIGGALAVGVLAADLLAFGMPYNPTCRPSDVYPSTELTDFLKKDTDFSRIMPLNQSWALREFPKAVLPPNCAGVYGLFDVQGYGSLYPVRYKALLDTAGGRDSCPVENGNMVFARNPGSPIYDLLGVRRVISREPIGGRHEKVGGCYVYRNPGTLPRAFLVHAIEYADDEEILRLIAEKEADLHSVVLVNFGDGERLDPWKTGYLQTPARTVKADRVRVEKYTFNTVTLSVEAARAGILVLTDQYSPGWKARVDEKISPVVRADYAFRAVAVPPGRHTVTFRYTPQPFEMGLRYARVALVLIVGLGIYTVVRYFGDRGGGESDAGKAQM